MLEYVIGNIFESEAEALVNPVNCKGAMGKGLASKFKEKYPKNYKKYKEICDLGKLKPGIIYCYKENNKWIVNFPTKNHWRNKSEIKYIKDGLKTLKHFIKEKDVKSIAIPPLGCGLGGLEWNDVNKEIEEGFEPIKNSIQIIVFEPN